MSAPRGPKNNTKSQQNNWKKNAASAIDIEAEWNYKAGVLFNDLSAAKLIPMHPKVSLGIGTGWNYIDGLFAIIGGFNLIFDNENHNQRAAKAKGILSILSGAQLFGLSYTPGVGNFGISSVSAAAPFAGPAFAFAMLCDMVNASIDFHYALKEIEFEGWLEERIRELQYVETRLAKFQESLSVANIFVGENIKKHVKNIASLEDKIESLEQRKQNLLEVIKTRSHVYYHEGDKSKTKEQREQFIQNQFAALNKVHPNILPQEQGLANFLKTSLTEDEKNTDTKIQQTLKKAYTDSGVNLFFKAASFIGMTLIAIAPFVACPPLAAVGLAITTFVAAYYLVKNFPKIKNALQQLFFKSHENKNDAALPISPPPSKPIP